MKIDLNSPFDGLFPTMPAVQVSLFLINILFFCMFVFIGLLRILLAIVIFLPALSIDLLIYLVVKIYHRNFFFQKSKFHGRVE